MTNSEVIRRFAERITNKHTGDVTGQSFSIVAAGRVLNDRGWWPLAFYLGRRKGSHLFLKQGDRYSVSTSEHQGEVQRACDGPTVSFTTLEAAGLKAVDVTQANLLDYSQDSYISLVRKDKDSPWEQQGEYVGREKGYADPTPFKQPKVGILITHRHSGGEPEPSLTGTWHTLGAALFRVGKRTLLASLDERMYFVAELSRPTRTVASAFKQLKPYAVQRREKVGGHVLRQGEWFFVPDGASDADLARRLGMTLTNFRYYQTGYAALPDSRQRDGRRRNVHETKWCEVDGALYAKGKVYHRTPGGPLTREHSTLTLGETWHRVYRNTERQSWSQSGRFD